jgi:hypothetical protein
MRILEAIARSPGNKAQAYNDTGLLVIVQERYAVGRQWWHCWLIMSDEVLEIESNSRSNELRSLFDIEWRADYWSPIG